MADDTGDLLYFNGVKRQLPHLRSVTLSCRQSLEGRVVLENLPFKGR